MPNDALQSIFGQAAHIVWEVQIVLDVAHGRDVHKTKGLVVTGNPAEESSSGRQGSEFDQCNMVLSIPEIMINAGGCVEGRLELQSHKEFSVKDIQVELESTEWAMDRKIEKTVAAITLCGPEKIAPNQLLQWPFSFNMPSGALPSVKIGHSGVVWKIKAVAVCGFFSDLVVEQEIQVFNSR